MVFRFHKQSYTVEPGTNRYQPVGQVLLAIGPPLDILGRQTGAQCVRREQLSDAAMMKSELTLPEIGLIAATRGMLGAGVGLLVAERLSDRNRKAVGGILVAIGALSTLPLMFNVFAKRRRQP